MPRGGPSYFVEFTDCEKRQLVTAFRIIEENPQAITDVDGSLYRRLRSLYEDAGVCGMKQMMRIVQFDYIINLALRVADGEMK